MIAQTSKMTEAGKSLLGLLENSRGYTLAVAEAMPIQLEQFKPADDTWNFREQLHHIAYGIEWWTDNFVKGIKADWNPPAVSKSRKEVTDYLNKAYGSFKEAIMESPMNDDQVNGIYATLDHITHHRGQCIVYLRCNGITPPEYTY